MGTRTRHGIGKIRGGEDVGHENQLPAKQYVATSQATKRYLNCSSNMDQSSSASAMDAREPAYRVQAPRASDAIGLALRDAYAREMGLPEDMATMLRQLRDFR